MFRYDVLLRPNTDNWSGNVIPTFFYIAVYCPTLFPVSDTYKIAQLCYPFDYHNWCTKGLNVNYNSSLDHFNFFMDIFGFREGFSWAVLDLSKI
jgi:hypothetical protein